jgi:hypothetical protein
VVKSWKELGIDIAEMDASTRASMDGQVPEDTKYGDWLKRQSKARQDEVLGPVRAKLFMPFVCANSNNVSVLNVPYLRL